MVDRVRYFTETLVLGDGALAAGTGKARYDVQTRCRLLEAELTLRATGATSGNTDVDVKKGGALVWTSPGLRIVQGAAAPAAVRAKPTVGVFGEPSGVPCEPGDQITVDIAAIPGTASSGGFVHLLFAAIDV